MKNKCLKKQLISLSLVAGTAILGLTGCMSTQRSIKNISSSMGGLDRTMKVYSYNGDLLETYTGVFDISESDSGGKVKFDLDGKRTIIYNAIVIVEEN